MEEAYRAGKLRAIGVSNFYPERLVDVAALAEIPPAVNQVETHPFRQQDAAHAVMAELGVVHEAWAPFAEGQNNIFADPTLAGIDAKHGKRPGQVVLRALMQKDVVVIPKSTHRERSCRRTSSSSRSRRTASAWPRTSTSSTSSWTPRTRPPSPPWTTAPCRASSTITTRRSSAGWCATWSGPSSWAAAPCTERWTNGAGARPALRRQDPR
nr:aldo/keto reductase [Propionibacterium acidifaciens]